MRRAPPVELFALAALALGGSGWYYRNYAKPRMERYSQIYGEDESPPPMTTTLQDLFRNSKPVRDGQDATTSARAYLEKEAQRGRDESVISVLNAAKTADGAKAEHIPGPGKFRLDVSRQGLAKTLRFMLDTKRMEEKALIDSVRRGHRPRGYEERLREMRQEKAELKTLIRSLEEKRRR